MISFMFLSSLLYMSLAWLCLIHFDIVHPSFCWSSKILTYLAKIIERQVRNVLYIYGYRGPRIVNKLPSDFTVSKEVLQVDNWSYQSLRAAEASGLTISVAAFKDEAGQAMVILERKGPSAPEVQKPEWQVPSGPVQLGWWSQDSVPLQAKLEFEHNSRESLDSFDDCIEWGNNLLLVASVAEAGRNERETEAEMGATIHETLFSEMTSASVKQRKMKTEAEIEALGKDRSISPETYECVRLGFEKWQSKPLKMRDLGNLSDMRRPGSQSE